MKTVLGFILTAVFALVLMPGCATSGHHASKPGAMECTVTDGKLLDDSGKPMNGCVMMHHGKMMVMNGKLMPMKKNMTMPDGTVCMVNGTCVMKDGTKRKFSEGEIISSTPGNFRVKGLSLPGSHY